jgi:hypothetical protein
MSTLITSDIITQEISFESASNPSILINQNGMMSVNENPFFYGWRDIGSETWENFGTTPVAYTYNIASENKGGHYNTSTGIFTCPLAGVYLICPSALMGASGGVCHLYVYKNGVNVTARGIHSNTNGFNLYFVNSYTFAIDCAANDQLQPRIITTNANVYGREHSHLSIWYYG